MHSNIEKIVENQSDIADMEDKSSNIRETAFEVQTRARKIEKEARKRQMKMYILIGVITVCVFLYVVVPLVTSDDWTDIRINN